MLLTWQLCLSNGIAQAARLAINRSRAGILDERAVLNLMQQGLSTTSNTIFNACFKVCLTKVNDRASVSSSRVLGSSML